MKYSFLEIVDNVLKSTLKCESKHTSFTDALFERLNENKSKVLLVDSDSGREWTAHELEEKIVTLSIRFLQLGIAKGDVVACFCPNSDFQVITMISLWSIGAIYTALYYKSPISESIIKVQ
ncbi:4-coumarate--CoA ligase-like 7 [Leptotrombidium deliense]|uniref:4-coumarate--CoA ligase-like 7 n=1 Tax=Leptotrombidium deliense TaxID=299467 RepID=A0A443RST6_9ACAR|nr:4-coumarate--CoA ligase-like 7 [Leptotrombidium deliense]